MCAPYEAHVVYLPQDSEKVLKRANELSFSISYIVGDPDLKDGLDNARLLYCTKRDTDFESLKLQIAALINEIDVPPIRYKIEVTLVDNIIDRNHNT